MRLLVMGGCMLDVKATATGTPRPRTSNPGRVRIASGGVGRNIAENLRRLGAEVVLATSAGNDPFAAYLEAELDSLDIDAHIIKKGTTAFDVGWFEESGEMVMGLCDVGSLEEIRAADLLSHVGPLKAYDAVVIEANLTESAVAELASTMREASIPYALEPVSIPKAPRLAGAIEGCFLVKPNREEAGALTGLDASTRDGAMAAARQLRRLGARHAIVSMGPDGFCYASEVGDEYFDTAQARVLDVTGAGDALLSAALVGLIAGVPQASLGRGMQRGAALACATPGAVARTLNPSIFEDGDEWQSAH